MPFIVASGKMTHMSVDVFLQGFAEGGAGHGGADEASSVLSPHISERDGDWARITTTDGYADVYLPTPDRASAMFNSISGAEVWDVIFDVALAARWVVMPVGRGTLLTDQAQRDDLPDGVPEPITVIRSGAELLATIVDPSAS